MRAGGRWPVFYDGEVNGLTVSGLVSNNYWSGTSNENNPDNAWVVDFNNGNDNWNDKDNTNYVWPVRAGK